MIIDLILDRKDGVPYNALKFCADVMEYEEGFEFEPTISNAFATKNEKKVKDALCDYIISQGYNKKICDYINVCRWLKSDADGDYLNRQIDRISDEFNRLFKDKDIEATLVGNSYVRKQMIDVFRHYISSCEDYIAEMNDMKIDI